MRGLHDNCKQEHIESVKMMAKNFCTLCIVVSQMLHCLCAGANSLKLQTPCRVAKLSCSQKVGSSPRPCPQSDSIITTQYKASEKKNTTNTSLQGKIHCCANKNPGFWLPLAFKRILRTPTKSQSPVSEMSTCPVN